MEQYVEEWKALKKQDEKNLTIEGKRRLSWLKLQIEKQTNKTEWNGQ